MVDDDIPTLTSVIRRGKVIKSGTEDSESAPTSGSADSGLEDLEALLSGAGCKLAQNVVRETLADFETELLRRIEQRLANELPAVLNDVLLEYFEIDPSSD